jgi:hypothetical protein
VRRKPMPVCVRWSRHVRRWLRVPWTQGRVRTTSVMARRPRVQEMP